jgi:hypothetical protein
MGDKTAIVFTLGSRVNADSAFELDIVLFRACLNERPIEFITIVRGYDEGLCLLNQENESVDKLLFVRFVEDLDRRFKFFLWSELEISNIL